MPVIPFVDSESFGNGLENENVKIVLNGKQKKRGILPEKSLSFDEHVFTREQSMEAPSMDGTIKKKKKKHGILYKRIVESFGEFAGHTRWVKTF